ncbi:MAG: hypothetical protein IAF08_13250 [Rhizobacter sp.]|nr:hypothetical protein [Chlorobiales bacterium]
MKIIVLGMVALMSLVFGLVVTATAQQFPKGSIANDVQTVGYTDLDGKPAFKMSIREHRGRWYLYTAHFWHRGWSVVDVTDPEKPRVVKFVAGPENTFTGQIELSGDIMITSLEKILPGFGGDDGKPFDEGVIIWNIADPINPKQVGQFRTGGSGTHRNFYSGGRYMHLAAGMPGYEGNIYVIVDISNPANPREVGRWHVKGQHTAGGEKLDLGADARNVDSSRQTQIHDHSICGTDADVSLHGPPYVVGNLAYLPYGSAGMIVLDVSDVTQPRQIGRLDFSPPFHPRFGVHGVLPIPEKNIAFANSEDVSYGKGPLHHASIIDISNPAQPFLLSLFPQPSPPPEDSTPDFFTKGGWSGPHNFNHLQHNPAVEKQGDLFYFAHFNAGLRIYNVSNRRKPVEVGFFMPPQPTKRFGPMPKDKLALQTEDVLVDRRGFIYITDKNQGLWIVKYQNSKSRTVR